MWKLHVNKHVFVLSHLKYMLSIQCHLYHERRDLDHGVNVNVSGIDTVIYRCIGHLAYQSVFIHPNHNNLILVFHKHLSKCLLINNSFL